MNEFSLKTSLFDGDLGFFGGRLCVAMTLTSMLMCCASAQKPMGRAGMFFRYAKYPNGSATGSGYDDIEPKR
jgi:hypothetical protein